MRRHLHMYPEIGFNEYDTSKYIAEFLQSINVEIITGIAHTGVIGVIKGNPGTSSIAIRADMDCLNVTEHTGLEYSSKNVGLMHACGHDGHMAALLGLAKYMSTYKHKLRNNLIFIFQPAEEGPGGAQLIVNSGQLEKFNIKAVLGMHIFPEIKQGMIGCCSGPLTARNAEIDIVITGKSGHGALPHTGIDSILATSQLLECIQTIVSRRIDPRENAVISFGKIYGGEARNIIAGKVTIEGTIRAFSKEIYDLIKESMITICDGIGKANNCEINVEIRDMYPEVCNDNDLFNILLQAAGEENVEVIKPLMISEDFSYYRQIAPELMFLLGSKNDACGYNYPLHNSKFNFDENILIKAVSVFSNMIDILDK